MRMYRYGDDWRTVPKKLMNLPRVASEVAHDELINIALGYVNALKQNVYGQRFSVTPPLAKKTQRLKGHGRYLYDTGEFLKKLRVASYRRKDSRGIETGIVAGGAFDSDMHDSKTSMFKIAKALEFGTSRIPGRPWFYRTLLQMKPRIKKATEQWAVRVSRYWVSGKDIMSTGRGTRFTSEPGGGR